MAETATSVHETTEPLAAGIPLGSTALQLYEKRSRAEQAMGYLEAGGLPPDQEALLAQAGFGDYVVGVNQSGTFSDAETVDLLTRNGGLPIPAGSPRFHFLFHDKQLVKEWNPDAGREDVREGYYHDPNHFRYVVAFPVHPEVRAEREDQTAQYLMIDYKRGAHPEDFYATSPETGDVPGVAVVNPRYVAGYVDGEQQYHVNPGFMGPTSTN